MTTSLSNFTYRTLQFRVSPAGEAGGSDLEGENALKENEFSTIEVPDLISLGSRHDAASWVGTRDLVSCCPPTDRIADIRNLGDTLTS